MTLAMFAVQMIQDSVFVQLVRRVQHQQCDLSHLKVNLSQCVLVVLIKPKKLLIISKKVSPS
jgi:hypothetical protein